SPRFGFEGPARGAGRGHDPRRAWAAAVGGRGLGWRDDEGPAAAGGVRAEALRAVAAADRRARQAAIAYREAEDRFASLLERLLGVGDLARLGLRRERQHRSADEERDEHEHDRELGEREAALAAPDPGSEERRRMADVHHGEIATTRSLNVSDRSWRANVPAVRGPAACSLLSPSKKLPR